MMKLSQSLRFQILHKTGNKQGGWWFRISPSSPVGLWMHPDRIGDKIVVLDSLRYLHYLSVEDIPIHNRGGIGIRASTGKRPDLITLIDSKNQGDLCFITEKGFVFKIAVSTIFPNFDKKGRHIKGKDLLDFFPNANIYSSKDAIVSMLFIPENKYSDGCFLVLGTSNGKLKKMPLSELKAPVFNKFRGVRCINFSSGIPDTISCSCLTEDGQDLFLSSSKGYICRFPSDLLLPTTRISQGVICQDLREDSEHLVSVSSSGPEEAPYLFVSGEMLKGKSTELKQYRITNRGRMRGIIALRLKEEDSFKCSFPCLADDQIICITTQNSINRFSLSSLPIQSRNSFGVRLIKRPKYKQGSIVRIVQALAYSPHSSILN